MSGDKSESSFECLNDISTKEDVLGFRPYVEAIAEFLTAEGTKPPITLSIEGQWGCGKSSFMKQLKEEIDKKNGGNEDKKYFTVWFNSWKYEKEDELWASFALNFMDELSKQLSWRHLQYSRLKLFYLRYKLLMKNNFLIFVHFSWNILSFLLIFSFLSLLITYVLHSLGMPLPNFFKDELIKNFSNFVLISAPFVGLLKYFSTEKWFIDVFRDPFGLKKLSSSTNYKEHISFRERFHADLNEITKSYVGDSKVYVFIDDLDRCEVPKAAELMQAINLMISENSKIYFILAMDRKVISAGLAAKNESILKYLDENELQYGYEFIEKFIQLPFKVPNPKSSDFLKFLTSADEIETSLSPSGSMDKLNISEDFILDEFPEEKVKSLQNESKGQETESDDFTNVENELDKQEIQNNKDCVEDFETSKMILEMVAPALDNNPRRIKQFINQFHFQLTIGKRIGLFSYNEGKVPEMTWNCKKLAKFVAISIKWNSIIYALNSNRTLFAQLQEYALTRENIKDLEKWALDERLINLLRYGCVEGENISQNVSEYTLSNLDFSELLQISPVLTYTDNSVSTPSSFTIGEMEFILIPKGAFMVGSSEEEVDKYSSETPLHQVTIRNPFYLGKYPVTQKQWIAVMGYNAARTFKGENRPVNGVPWNEVQRFIKELNEMENTNKYRLPSEAEWEYACRAGTTTSYYFGNDESKLGDYAWYKKNSRGETHPVGQKKPNPWGLYDMYGNVYEWVQDRWHNNYKSAPSDGSAWEDGKGSGRVFRGGGWHAPAGSCWSTTRNGNKQYLGDEDVGFRLVREL